MKHLRHKLLYGLLTGIVILWSASAFAQIPTTGLVYNTREWHSIRFNCRLTGEPWDVVTCDMAQVAIRKQADASGLKEKIDKALEELRTGKPMSQEECNGYSKFVAALSGATTDLPEELKLELSKKWPAEQKQDLVKLITAMLNYCRSPSAATMTEFARTQHEQETRTCLVSTNIFTQTFKRLAGSNSWISNDGPSGPCGTVVIARLQTEPGSVALWNYITRKTITNPDGKLSPLGGSCSQLDQTEYVYDWRSEDKLAKCDYIKFGW